MKNTIKVLWYIIISTMVLTMFVLVSMSWGHSEGGEVVSGYDYGADHRKYQDYDTHHDHGSGWHWHRDGSGNSYEDKHNSDLGACNHADAWVGGCIGVGNPDPPVEEDLYTLYHDHLDYYGIDKHLLHRHLKTEGDNDGDHYHDPPEQSDDEPFVSRRNDVIHSHNYTDLDPDDPANVNVNEWHQHKKEARGDDGSFDYAPASHHGSAQRDSGHDGSVDNPEPSDFDFEPGILPEMEVVTPEYPVKPVVDTVTPTAPTEIMETLDEVKDQEPTIPDKIEAEVLDAEPIEMTDEKESYNYIFIVAGILSRFPSSRIAWKRLKTSIRTCIRTFTMTLF